MGSTEKNNKKKKEKRKKKTKIQKTPIKPKAVPNLEFLKSSPKFPTKLKKSVPNVEFAAAIGFFKRVASPSQSNIKEDYDFEIQIFYTKYETLK